MTTLYELEQYAKENLLEYFECDDEDNVLDFGQYPEDNVHDVADGLVPVYTSDLMQLAADNLLLAIDEPELGPAFDGSHTPANIVAANIYEHLERILFEYLYELQEEYKNREPGSDDND